MADLKLTQVPTLTDFDYMLLVKGDQVAKMEKATLATVVAGIIGFNNTVLKSINLEGRDANGIDYTGYYINGNTMSNVPADYGTFFSFIVPGMTVQLYVAADSTSTFFVRNYSASAWQPWKQLQFV